MTKDDRFSIYVKTTFFPNVTKSRNNYTKKKRRLELLTCNNFSNRCFAELLKGILISIKKKN